MKETQRLLDELLAKGEQYAESSVELAQLKAAKHIANTSGVFFTHLFVWLTLVIAIFLLSIGASIWIGESLGEYYYGFLIVAGFYFFLALVIKLFKSDLIQRPVQNFVIRNLFNKE